jgi:hypothetical protein
MTKHGYATLKLVAVVILALSIQAAPQRTYAECAQPSVVGCAVEMNGPVSGVFAAGDDVHLWRLHLDAATTLHIVLGNLSVDYDLHVYTGDESPIAEAISPDTLDHVVDIPDAQPGTYLVYVNSPFGEVSPTPYTLSITGSDRSPAAEATVGPAPMATPTSVAPDKILLADNFDDPGHGWLPVGAVTAGNLDYRDGEYQIAKTDAAAIDWPTAVVPGVYADSSIAMNVRFLDPIPAYVVFRVSCRRNGPRGYIADVRPGVRTAALSRADGDMTHLTTIALETPQPSLERNAPFHLELACIGPTISLSLNGVQAISAQDATFTAGADLIAAGTGGSTSDARISHLVLSRP